MHVYEKIDFISTLCAALLCSIIIVTYVSHSLGFVTGRFLILGRMIKCPDDEDFL